MKRKLANPIDVHWWTTLEGREYIKRMAFDLGVSLTELHRIHFLDHGWQSELIQQRKRHRKAGISDNHFK